MSGAVEPDTIVVSRSLNGDLSIASKELGSKKHRITVGGVGAGLSSEEVPEAERNAACISDDDVMRLARIGVQQEELWAAPRDIEWAIAEVRRGLVRSRSWRRDTWSVLATLTS